MQATWLLCRILAAATICLLFPPLAKAEVHFTTTNAVWKFFKGYSEASTPSASLWREPVFNDSQWPTAPAPFYYSDTATEPPFYFGGPFTGTVLNDMINNYSTAFFRKTFVVNNVGAAGPVTIQIAGDDGFIVWLNGAEVNRTNVPAGHIPYNGTALASRTEPYPVHSFVLTNASQWLLEGTNVLAVHVINSVSNSHDFGFMAGLSVEQDATPPVVAAVHPVPGLFVSELTSIRVVFNEAVTNVEAADLLINNQAAASVTATSAIEYTFSFPQPGTGLVSISWATLNGIQDRSGNSFAGGNWTYQLNTNAVGFAIISEFMAENGNSLLDEDGESSDWIEIYNPGPLVLNLNGWCLTDDATELTKWRFPSTNLAANAYLIVFASGKNRGVAGAPLHTNFRLNQEGGYLALVQSNGLTIASEFAPTYPPQRENISFGIASGGAATNYFPTPSPGASNAAGVLGFVADTTFSVDRGFFFAPTNVTISTPTLGATLVYTLNGTEPSQFNGTQVNPSNAMTSPSVTIPVTNTTLLRAFAFKAGHLATDVDTHTYIFPASVAMQTRPGWLPSTWPGGYAADFEVDTRVVSSALPGYSFTNALLSLPSISIVMPSNDLFSAANGIYANSTISGDAWDRRAAAELIFPDGQPGFHINCGVRIRGASSADKSMTPKHSLSLFFRSEYGPAKLEFPLFTNSPVQKFDHLALRGCSTDSWMVFDDPYWSPPRWSQPEASYMRDQWMRDSQRAMGSPSSHGRYVHLYLDGLYWGVYNLSERPDESFAAEHLGGNKEEYDSVSDAELNSGDLNAWNSLMQAAQSGFSTDTAYQRVLGNNADGTRNTNYPVLVHLTNLVDTMILHIYAGAVDWPHHNWWAARQRGANSDGYRFFVWDQEISNNSLTRTQTDTSGRPIFTEVASFNSPAFVYAAMRQNAEFRVLFGDRVHKHLFNNGALSTTSSVARWNARVAEIDRAMVGESARWADFRRPSLAYKRETEWASNNNWVVNTYFPSNAAIALKRFRDANLYPALGAPSFSQFGGSVPTGYQLAITHTNASGTLYFTVDGSDPRLRGGAVAASASAYSQAVTLLSPTLVRARVRNGTNWSALVAAQFTTPQDFSKLLLSELHYNPPMSNNVDGEEFEFLELQNIGTNTLDLGGLSFTQGINFTFSNETLLAPGAFFVLVRNAAQFSARFPGAPWHGLFTGKLDNGGETIRLSGPSGATLFAVTYDDLLPWPLDADGPGFSLQRVNYSPDIDAANNWIAAIPTPGAALPSALFDTDGDGMTDVWEDTHGFDWQGAADAGADADADGSANVAEFRAGTDPRNANDYLRLFASISLNQPTPAIVFRFHAATNRSYSVLSRALPDQGCWTIVTNISAAGSREVVMTNDTALSGAQFFRLVTPSFIPACQ